MNATCRSCLCVFFVIGCMSAWTEDKPGPKRSEYDRFIQSYTGKVEPGWFPGPKGEFDRVQVPLKLIVTAIENDGPQANAQEPEFFLPTRYGCQVAADGRVYIFYKDSMGSRGGGYPTIPDVDQKRLDKLLLKVPDDGARLPPPGRRVVLQVPEGDHSRAHVYDRANVPDEVWEILRRSFSGIQSWVPEIKSESDIRVGSDARHGLLALTPAGQLVVASLNSSLTFWDPTTHKKVNERPWPKADMTPQWIKFSPDGSLAVLTAWGVDHCVVLDAKTWNVLHDFFERGIWCSFPQFVADGRYLVYLYDPWNGYDPPRGKIISSRIYDTRTWQKLDRLPGFPDDCLTCVEASKTRRVVLFLKGNVVALWDSERHAVYATLDEDVRIREVAFSPDESMVAMATVHKRDDKYWTTYRIRVWKTDTGELVHELRPFETASCENVVGLQWTADGQYILAETNAGSISDRPSYDIKVWNARSGRHRANLGEGLSSPLGVVMLPDGRHLAAGGDDNWAAAIRFWDLAAALKQIRAFEDSLAGPKAGK